MNLNTRNLLELQGNLVYLKKLDKEHVEEYWQGIDQCSIEATVFTGTRQVFGRSEIEGYLDDISSDRSRVDFAMFSKESNHMIGEVAINDIDLNNSSANIRIAINKKDDFGKGYGSEAMALAMNYGFGMLNLHRIELEVLSFNVRAIHTYEKLGFKQEGVKRDGCFFNHRYYNLISMSILEEEFRMKHINNDASLEEFYNHSVNIDERG